MTKSEALKILRNGNGGYVDWDEKSEAPNTGSGTVILDGTFSKEELLALIFFLQNPGAD